MEHEVSVSEKLSNGALKDKGIHILVCLHLDVYNKDVYRSRCKKETLCVLWMRCNYKTIYMKQKHSHPCVIDEYFGCFKCFAEQVLPKCKIIQNIL